MNNKTKGLMLPVLFAAMSSFAHAGEAPLKIRLSTISASEAKAVLGKGSCECYEADTACTAPPLSPCAPTHSNGACTGAPKTEKSTGTPLKNDKLTTAAGKTASLTTKTDCSQKEQTMCHTVTGPTSIVCAPISWSAAGRWGDRQEGSGDKCP
jgi:hypothetical protein